MTWQHYLKDTRDELLPRYVELCEDIAVRMEELAVVQVDEKTARVHGFKTSESTAVTGREWDATSEALSATSEVIKLRAELEAIREERELIRYILDSASGPDDA